MTLHVTPTTPDADVPGYRSVTFRGGELHGLERWIRLPIVEGDRYNRLVPVDETWAYDEGLDLFVLVTAEPSIICAKCGRTSYNPTDIAEGYCGACHEFTS